MLITEKIARIRAAKAVLESATATHEEKETAKAFILALKNATRGPSEADMERLLTQIEEMLGDHPTDEQIALAERLLGIIVSGTCANDAQASKAAALLGGIKSPAKAAASRENGKRGGRPRTGPQPVTITIERPAKPEPVSLPWDELSQVEERGE